MSHSKLVYHVVFPTHRRGRTISEEHDEELYAYLSGIARRLGCFVYAVGGMPDHVHAMLGIPPAVSVSDCVKALKQHSSAWLRDNAGFPRWEGWGKGYAVFTCSPRDIATVGRYVRGQKEHHRKGSFVEELKKFLASAGISYDERYLM